MWSPTHVQVLVKRAKGLNIKGKNGTNDVFVTINLGKERFQTSVKEKAGPQVDWGEQCELSIPSQGNTADVALTVLHRNFIGVDEFLGQLSLPLREFDIYERPKSRWFPLKCKPGKNKTDYRGELEVKLGFTVKASTTVGGSTADLAKKNKGSLASINRAAGVIGGSLMSIGGKEKNHIKNIAKSVGHKVEKVKDKAKKTGSSLKLNKDKRGGLEALPESGHLEEHDSNQDPGVNSDEEDDDEFQLETISQPSPASSSLSRRSSGSRFGKGEADTDSFKRNSRTASGSSSGKRKSGSDKEWEAKLQGKRVSVVEQQPSKEERPVSKVKGSQSSLPSYNEATEETSKKKIIPVQSDLDSSPSPEHLQTSSPPLYQRNRFRMSQSTINLAQHDSGELERRKKSLGLKLKTSYSFVRERPDPVSELRRNSVESTNSRTFSETSMEPPGSRVVLGRETSPSPETHSRLHHDVLSRFNGKTREDLIEIVVSLQSQLDEQARKVGDLEDYIDNMLIKILEVAPILLKKPSPVLSKNQHVK